MVINGAAAFQRMAAWIWTHQYATDGAAMFSRNLPKQPAVQLP